MTSLQNAIQAGIAGIALLLLSIAPAGAGSVGGPSSQTITVPQTGTMTLNVQLRGGEQAVVSVIGDGGSQLELYIYDGDNHIISGTGGQDRKTARINVYRTGSFRVLVKNFGSVDNAAQLVTN